VECGYLSHNPTEGVTTRVAGGKETSRERVLSLDEVRAMWRIEAAHASLLRVLLLTGCRIAELQRARVRDLQLDREYPENPPLSLVIPADHSKNGRAHRVPLTGLALANINTTGKPDDPLFPGSSSPYVVQCWLKRLHQRAGVVHRWTPHDLRRTFATQLQVLGVPIETIQRCLNHTLDGDIATYARHDSYPERRAALAKLAAWVGQTVEFDPL
jgi:integrase